ncbi:MAG: hypothetical protein HQK51_13905 [Oligoflexia bacterium]|nr:hypothetical protein [Oligoflexia bacterium]
MQKAVVVAAYAMALTAMTDSAVTNASTYAKVGKITPINLISSSTTTDFGSNQVVSECCGPYSQCFCGSAFIGG